MRLTMDTMTTDDLRETLVGMKGSLLFADDSGCTSTVIDVISLNGKVILVGRVGAVESDGDGGGLTDEEWTQVSAIIERAQSDESSDDELDEDEE